VETPQRSAPLRHQKHRKTLADLLFLCLLCLFVAMLENLGSLSTLAVWTIGLVFGLKHATEVDHVVAISTIVSQHKNVLRSALVGALWGAGHTASLLVIGVVVLSLRVTIPERVSGWLQFAVALMIIALGISALWRVTRKNSKVHLHKHSHDGLSHTHVHFHEAETNHKPSVPAAHSHAVSRVGWKPVLIGMMHGLAGSAALTLLILTQIGSFWIGFLYLVIFGIGSTVGMLLMSGLIGLPFALTSNRLTHLHEGLQAAAAVLSICFGIWYAYEVSSGVFAR
jgi:ABC-type nickel/cobalt efflux system permease component RcnA